MKENMQNVRLAIIAALDREIQPLVRGWQRTDAGYRQDDTLVVAGGIGYEAARRAAQAVVKDFRPQMLVSAGFAGALIGTLKVGNVFLPNVIIDGRNGMEYRCNFGEGILGGGILVSAAQIAGSASAGCESKKELAEKFHALAVDMEAAGVAEVAREEGIGFRCVKAISDEADFPMPPMNRFISPEGGFNVSGFAAWAIVRPAVWSPVIALARNSNRAARALCAWLEERSADGIQPAQVVRVAG